MNARADDAVSTGESERAAYILSGETMDRSLLGGKAAALAQLAGSGLPIPAWFVLSPSAFHASLTVRQRSALAAAHNATDVRAALTDLALGPNVREQLFAAFKRLCPDGGKVAVRSSATYEDAAQHSFAGQLESYLDVTEDSLAGRILDVWRSGFSERILAYRSEHGMDELPAPPAVLVQRMVGADVAGVAFSADPVSGRRSVAVVAAVRGYGEGLVSGEKDADSWRVGLGGEIVERALVHDEHPVLTDDQVRAVAQLARSAAAHFGRAQDVEWAIEAGQLFLLQSRPITALADVADPEAERILWDNSNIIESYGGMTTPLTYSFAQRAYAEVYQQFCRVVRVPEHTIRANQSIFSNMIGLIRGRIYYNLYSWYRLLALLPGFRANRRFMEQMMGVGESLPAEIVASLEQSTWRQRMADRFYLARTAAGLLGAYAGLDRSIRAFYARLHRALGEGRPDLSGRRADELVRYYRELDGQLLHRWDAPLVNDFFAMIFYGLLRSLAVKWCDDEGGTLQNDLIMGEGGMVSAEPADRIRDMAVLAREADTDAPGLVQALCEGSPQEIARVLAGADVLREAYEAYLTKFGDRCLNELKLESPTLYDDPLPLARAVGQLAAYGPSVRAEVADTPARAQAEAQVRSALVGKPLRRAVFFWVLRNARARIRDRENLRFERTRVFGRARHILGELGKRFYAVDALADARDVYYLTLDEVLGFVEGTTASADLSGLVAVRKAEFALFAQMPPPARRFETTGMVHQGNLFQAVETASAGEPIPAGAGSKKGVGSCPGIVRGRARVVSDPLTAQLQPGDIVVAEHTDPSWIMILPLAAGLLVERGSLLSHAAIVSRELGIPSIVSLTAITDWVQDGEMLEFDGSTGVVRKLGSDGGRLP